MAGRLTEEKITKLILKWLETNDWKIICYDFPQSGTGISLHPNAECRELTKNKGAIIPDIIAVKEKTAVFFENKDRFFLNDFEKIYRLKMENNYSEAVSNLLKSFEPEHIYYGIGLPHQNRYLKRIEENLHLADFVILLDEEFQITVLFETAQIF